jgi:arabinogalactan oligomer/maltooligosaccharide transport system permease protein
MLYDTLGNTYPRKNLYLKDLSESKRVSKDHPYLKALEAYRAEEKRFLKQLRVKIRGENFEGMPPKAVKMKRAILNAQAKTEFYSKYVDLTYDAEFNYESQKIILNQMPALLDTYLEQYASREQLKSALKTVSQSEENEKKDAFKAFKKQAKSDLEESKRALKLKRREGIISEKALKNGIKEMKRHYKDRVNVKSYEQPKRHLKASIGSLNYALEKGTRRQLDVIRSNISDLKRKTPVESFQKVPFLAWATILIPGLGQILQKQYVKSIIFFVATFFIYVIAIPYALGFGNYQGEGIAGLISLAEGGAKIDKSLIFMIEGILSIVFLAIGFALILLSFFDVKNVERQRLKGIRPNDWFETRQTITQEGFPYLVSAPALVIVLFIVLVPVATTVLLSFTGMDPKHQSKFSWVGIDNYRLIAAGEGIAGSAFWSILGWTVIWTLVATTVAILIGFFLALITNGNRIRGKGFFRTMFLLPWAVPAFISIMFFSIMLSPNGALTTVINTTFHIDIEVKNDPTLARIALIMIQGWLGSAYVFLLSTGVLQAIPGDLYEAADIDGASAWQKITKITLPIVLFQTAPLLVGQYTFNFNNFSVIYLFNQGGPFNPVKYGNLAGSTDLLISYIYKLTIDNQYQAIAAAVTVFISLGLMVFAFIGFRNSKAFKEERL